MDNSNIRIAKVSSVDRENGMIRVIFESMGNMVSQLMPVLNFNGEYKLPEVDDEILVLKLTNESYTGIALSAFWSQANAPEVSDNTVYHKDFGNSPNEAFIDFDGHTLIIHAPKIKIEEEGEGAG